MAKYNAAKHTIETDTGELLATLTHSVRADDGFKIADFWKADNEQEFRDRISDLEAEAEQAEDDLRDRDKEISEAQNELSEAKARIEDLEDRIEELESKLNEKEDAQ